MTDYRNLVQEFRSLSEGVLWDVTVLSNASALIYQSMENLNWAGFYVYKEGSLRLGPFQGKAACILIPEGKGVCGKAFSEGTTVVVPDVHSFPGHIACDSASESEMVIPIRVHGALYGVLDLDSPVKDRFCSDDREALEEFVRALEEVLERAGER